MDVRAATRESVSNQIVDGFNQSEGAKEWGNRGAFEGIRVLSLLLIQSSQVRECKQDQDKERRVQINLLPLLVGWDSFCSGKEKNELPARSCLLSFAPRQGWWSLTISQRSQIGINQLQAPVRLPAKLFGHVRRVSHLHKGKTNRKVIQGLPDPKLENPLWGNRENFEGLRQCCVHGGRGEENIVQDNRI